MSPVIFNSFHSSNPDDHSKFPTPGQPPSSSAAAASYYNGNSDQYPRTLPGSARMPMVETKMQQVPIYGFSPYQGNLIPSPDMFNSQMMGGIQPLQYQLPSPSQYPLLSSPSLGSNSSFSPNVSNNSPKGNVQIFPDSPPLMDVGQMLMSPSRFRKRRQSPLLTGYNTIPSPRLNTIADASMKRNLPVLKVAVSPKSPTLGASPKSKPQNLILPCYLNQDEKIIPQGPLPYDFPTSQGYWEETRRNASEFLREADAIDEENITIIEIKQMLRKYRINATGKKVTLMERIRNLQTYFHQMEQLEKERQKKLAQQTKDDNVKGVNN